MQKHIAYLEEQLKELRAQFAELEEKIALQARASDEKLAQAAELAAQGERDREQLAEQLAASELARTEQLKELEASAKEASFARARIQELEEALERLREVCLR